jgi:hypothetical protein
MCNMPYDEDLTGWYYAAIMGRRGYARSAWVRDM